MVQRPHRIAVVAVITVLTVSAIGVTLAQAYTPSQPLRYIRLGLGGSTDDLILNYDGGRSYKRRDRDWPVGLIFSRGATVNKVKSIFDDEVGYNGIGGAKYYPYKDSRTDGHPRRMDKDKGKKTGCNKAGRNEHFRVYGGADDHFYTRDYGYVVAGTAHYDHGDGFCKGRAYFGFSENVEYKIVEIARDLGYTVRHDHIGFRNRERPRMERDHYWKNDGRASLIRVP